MKTTVSTNFMFAGILFAACLLISNILAVKIIMIGPWAAPAGVLIFPVSYIINDVIAEVWGYKKVRLIIWAGFAVNIMAILFYSLSIAMPAASFWGNQSAYSTILSNTPRIAVASLVAYLVGSFMNAWVMSRVKVLTNGKNFSFRAVLSTIAGEGMDSTLFISIAFAGLFPSNVLLTMILTQAFIKVAFEMIALPLTIMVVKWIKRDEGIDTFDTEISYNPFKLSEI
ncbi:MAG: queuosine precursor transporter [Bacteroidetes bacterium]|nr:queuosine precursor transporter [Bacteroidota bacterium]